LNELTGSGTEARFLQSIYTRHPGPSGNFRPLSATPGIVMSFVLGLLLTAVTGAMVVVGRPADGISAPFLKNWFVGQLYALAAMVSAVIGVAILISAWPF
jgi:hypothetical protein